MKLSNALSQCAGIDAVGILTNETIQCSGTVCTKGKESLFNAYGDILFFNFFLTSIVHYNLSEVEEHDLAVLPHSMYSLLEAKDKFCLIFQ